MGGLDSRHRAVLGFGNFDQLLRRALLRSADIQMIPHQQQKRFRADELAAAKHGMTVTERLLLFDELQSFAASACRSRVSFLVTGRDDDANLLDARGQNLLDDDAQRRLGGAIPVHQGLQRERPLTLASRCDDGLFDFHRFELV